MPTEFKTCIDCGSEFEFTEEDQEFISRSKDFETGNPYVPPKRCKPCRIKKKAKRNEGGEGYGGDR